MFFSQIQIFENSASVLIYIKTAILISFELRGVVEGGRGGVLGAVTTLGKGVERT